MNTTARFAVAATLLLFSWKGATLEMPWPQAGKSAISSPKPSSDEMAWASAVGDKAKTMLPQDRVYLSRMYDAMAFVLERDGDRGEPIIRTNDQFVLFHTSTLRLSIDKKNVGIYPGLDVAIDKAFISAIGAESVTLDADTRKKLVAACAALSWTLSVGGDG